MATGEARPRTEDAESVKAEWLDRLDALIEDVERWATMSGWRTRRIANLPLWLAMSGYRGRRRRATLSRPPTRSRRRT